MRKLILLILGLSIFGIGLGQKVQQYVPVPSSGAEAGDEYYNPFGPVNVIPSNVNTDEFQAWVIPGLGATSGNTRCPGNTWNYQRTQYLITAAEMAASGFPSGNTVDGIGFLIQTAGGTSQTGTFKVWLMNTSDATYGLGATWTTAGFTEVSNIASWTVPIAATSYTVNFSGGSPFTYTGGGVYVAWEFSNPGAIGTTALVANCNTSLVGGLYGQRSLTALPTALVASNWRPATIFINNSSVDVLQVTNIYAQEKCPVPYGVPTSLSARVANVSASSQSFDVTVTVTDQTTSAVRYTNTQTVTALAAGTGTVVDFAPWTASITENDNVTVSIPLASGETVSSNNTKVIPVNVNNNLYGYCYVNTPTTGYGFTYNTTSGIFASKFYMNGSGTVPGANLYIYNYAANTGNTIYAVVLNSAGVVVAQSANLVIAAGDLGTNKNFTFPTPPGFSNEEFYVGLAQPMGGTAQWYPMGCMSEAPARAGTFFTFDITGGIPEDLGADYKYMIEAQVAASAATVNPTSFTATPVSSSQINLTWGLNPSNNNVLLAWSPTGVFGTPVDGTTYTIGSTIPGGGTVLQYNNATSYNHTGLTASTLYYYKAWSYSGSTYSNGTGTNATTMCNPTVAPFTESFEATVFPPACWSTSSGSPAWVRSTAASGYSVGTASAEADFYNISSNTPFDLVSLQFSTTGISNPALRFDYAYATYATEVDQLDIYYSINNGNTYSLLLAMPGGPTGILNTAGASTTAFVPTASQWATKTLALPAGTNKVRFRAISAYGNNLYVDNIQVLNLLGHDVGVVSIDEGQIVTLGGMSPKATVRNFGSNTETFTVTLSTTGYSSTKTVTSLAPDAAIQVVFDPWTNSLGDYSFTCCAALGTDLNTSNDCAGKDIKVLDLNKQVYAYQNSTIDGPVKFNLSDPGSLNVIVDQTTLAGVFGGTWANDLWYGTEYNTVAPFNLITIDPLTGTRTIIGNMGVNMTGLSYNAANGIMYAVGYDGVNSNLYSVNTGTGSATLIGTAGPVLLINLAIDASGNCFALDIGADQLGTINLATGAFTSIGSIGFNANFAQDMEFDRETGELYMAAYGTTGDLRWVNKTTGNTMVVGQFQGGVEVTGFAIPYTAAPPTKDLSVKVFIEGLYNGAGGMNQAYNDLGPQWTYPIADKVNLELRSSVDGSLVLAINDVNLEVDGTIDVTVDASYNGSYYIYVYHRNSIVTSTAAPVSFAGATIAYDFSTGIAQAFGSNMKDVAGVAVLFGGDVGQDGLVDSSDMIVADNDASAFAVGYILTDVDGNGLVDSSDMILIDNNSAAFVASVLPF